MVTFRCSNCKKEKPATEFHADRKTTRGYSYACKECRLNLYVRGTENKKVRAEKARKWRKESPQHLVARRKRRIDVLNRLGGKCVCCGESRIEFLTIDHVKGLSHRTSRDSGDMLINQIRNSNYSTEEFRVLCYNCNSAIGFFGYCPHQEPEKDFLTRDRIR